MAWRFTGLSLVISAWACRVCLGDSRESSCTSASDPASSAPGHSYLQAKTDKNYPGSLTAHVRAQPLALSELASNDTSRKQLPDQNATDCALPVGAIWCQVRLKGLPAYYIAVHTPVLDWVSNNICTNGSWEEDNPARYGKPGHMLDIGGNIGYYSFAFAQAGWKIETFEPMAENLALIKATMCRNPILAQQIHLNAFGLGNKSQECVMMSAKNNVGDGVMKCTGEQEVIVADERFEERGRFTVRRFDEALQERAVAEVDLVKIDVEGYELQVFSGAPNFFQLYHPRIIRSEAWPQMVGGSNGKGGEQYVSMFKQAGYKFYWDADCTKEMDASAELIKGGVDMFMCRTA